MILRYNKFEFFNFFIFFKSNFIYLFIFFIMYNYLFDYQLCMEILFNTPLVSLIIHDHKLIIMEIFVIFKIFEDGTKFDIFAQEFLY